MKEVLYRPNALKWSGARPYLVGFRTAVLFFGLLALLFPRITVGQASTQGAKANEHVVPGRLKEAIGCLVAAKFIRKYGLKYVGLKVGEWAWVGYRIGSIPGIGGTPGVFNVMFYSSSRKRGILLFATPNDRKGFDAIYNGYHLHKHGSMWTADYGNGGFHLYENVSRFVTKLSKAPRYRVLLTPGGRECGSLTP